MTAVLASCQPQGEQNPLLGEFRTPFGVPPFDRIRVEHYMPAFEQAIAEARADVDAIVSNPEAPTFENTIAVLDRSGSRLTAVSEVFFNLNEAATSERMQQIALEVSPMVTAFGNDTQLNPELYKRVSAVYEQRESLGLTAEQEMLLEDTYLGFVRSGAGLSDADKDKYRQISEELSSLSLQFGQNVLAANNAFTLHLTDEADLAGLPDMQKEAAAEEARARGLEGWAVTLDAPSLVPFLQYAERRDLRREVWTAYNSRALTGEFNNTDTLKRIANLRLEMANLLGYPSYADFALEQRMAGSSRRVNDFLEELLGRAMPYARKDYEMIDAYARSQGLEGPVMPWDWSFYQDKYKAAHYDLNDEMIRPYFQLEKVEGGVFLLANKLYGLEFRENKELPVYHPDVKGFEVYDDKGKFMSILYIDYFPRDSKRGGAWMTGFREQYVTEDGTEVRPVVSLVCNFTKPSKDTPSLLTFGEAQTLLHEFGHALHGMLSEGHYAGVTGTNVYRDFVELPSQIMENWLTQKDFLDLWAEHYQTGEKIPQALVDKIVATQQFLSGFMNSRQLSYGMLDMAWHSITEPVTEDAVSFERRAMDRAQILPRVDGVAMSPAFGHIFGGGYAAGYYGYKWAEVLDADAFAYFLEEGIFNREIAGRFREHILSKGGSARPEVLYERFRGKPATTDA
ncbi:M3 family metallopeptidase, partial [Alistipes sp. OttesenSCG-928-L06]|nr:M3 family metallopeptidase [Alistipes sp. OttesenSCG-928-L06]